MLRNRSNATLLPTVGAKITEIPTYTTFNQGWVSDLRAWVKIAESCLKTLYNLWYVICTIYGHEKGSTAPVCSRYIKKAPLYFKHATQKFNRWKQFKFFILSANLLLRESPFHIVNCLKLLDFTSFFVYTLKLLNTLVHFVLYFEKHMTYSKACGSRVVLQLFNKTMQKLSAKVSKRGPATSLTKGGPIRQPCSPSVVSTPALNYIQKKKLPSFYNTIELIKVVCNVIKIFFDHSVILRIT